MTVPGRLAPRLVTRALLASFLTVAVILGAVFVLLTLDMRQRVRQTVAANLDAGQQVFAQVEGRREEQMIATVSTLAENPTLKAALDTWQLERRAGGPDGGGVATVENELKKIAGRVGADVLAIVDRRGEIVASAGPRAPAFRPGLAIKTRADETSDRGDAVVTMPAGVFRVIGVPLLLEDVVIGTLQLGTALDEGYARQLAALARAHSAIVIDDHVAATTLPPAAAEELVRYAAVAGRSSTIVELGGESWAVRQVHTVGPATSLALASIDAAAAEATSSALGGLLWIALASLAFAALGSLWLAQTLTRPIDQLSASLAAMSVARRFDAIVPASGTSRELDALADTFNQLFTSLAKAEAETQAAYLGAIHALAAALDARDPYTAGHSERVSALSVEMGRALGLDETELGTLRLGALLHDIGKIGVPDEILRKPETLTGPEFELIRAHPVIGARILRSIPFLEPHLPIVELHHERPDGEGYPYGLRGDAIPLAARIVHVADAYDAMTSARAYRPARLPQEAIGDLQRGVGTDFDRPSVDALISALPRLPTASAGFDPTAFQWAVMTRPRRS